MVVCKNIWEKVTAGFILNESLHFIFVLLKGPCFRYMEKFNEFAKVMCKRIVNKAFSGKKSFIIKDEKKDIKKEQYGNLVL